jgi:glycosyltransferase involved in cell wall biosynthesis
LPNVVAHPKVTAVIPAYDMAVYIERALASAIGQTYPNLDILVIDDGSTDDTARIAARIAGEHPSVRLVTTANAGVAAARNLGTQMSDSLYVAYLDADDLWHPLKIEKQVEALATHRHTEEWGACYSLHRMIDSLDNVLDDSRSWHLRGDFFEEHLVVNPIGNGSNLLVRRDLALAVGGFDPSYAKAGIGGCEDLEFQLKVLRRSNVEIVREFLVGYRLHAAQMSGDVIRMRLSRLAVVEKIIGENETSKRARKRALVQSYLTLAKGFLVIREWRAAAKWVFAGCCVSPLATARKIPAFFRRELRYWTLRATRRVRPPAETSVSLRSFAEYDPREGVDADPRKQLRYRSSLARQAEARSNRRSKAGQAQTGS